MLHNERNVIDKNCREENYSKRCKQLLGSIRDCYECLRIRQNDF